jgi:hypothetical protein
VIDAKCSRFLVFDGKKQRLCTGCANEVVAERSGVTKRKSLKTAEGSDMGILEEVKKQFPTASDLDPFSPPTVPDSALKPPPVRIGFGVPADLAAALKTYSPGSTGEIKPPVSTHTSDGYSYANESSEDADNPDDFEVLSVTIEPKHHESEEVQEEAPKTRSGTIVKLKKNILTAQKSRAPEKSKYNLAYEVGDQVKVFMKVISLSKSHSDDHSCRNPRVGMLRVKEPNNSVGSILRTLSDEFSPFHRCQYWSSCSNLLAAFLE